MGSQKVSRGGGVSWTVYFDETTGSLKMAERSFLKMHGQKPTASELEQIRAFLTMSKPQEVTRTVLMNRIRSRIRSEHHRKCWYLRFRKRRRRSGSMCIWRTPNYRRKRPNRSRSNGSTAS